MKLPELKKKFTNKYVIRIVAGVLTIALVGAGASAYTVKAEKADNQEAVTAETESGDSETEETLDRLVSSSVSFSEKEIGKEESVYLITDASGNVEETIVTEHLVNKDGSATLEDRSDLENIENIKGNETFTQDGNNLTWQADGNDIYYQGTSAKEAPVTQKVTYYLDGEEIKPEELAGKSGRVTIHFDYTNNTSYTETVNGEKVTVSVPFAAVTALMLDDSFSNIEVTNGKVENNGDTNIVIGYALPGIKDSLGVDDSDFDGGISLPEEFEVSADVENFSLDMAMTIVANAANFVDADGADTSSLDSMINELADAGEQLQSGSADLADGLDTLQASLGDFSKGMNTLAGGLKDYTDGASQLNSGIGTVQGGMNALVDGAGSLADGVSQLNSGAAAVSAGIQQLDNALNAPLTEEEKAAYEAAAKQQFDAVFDSQADTLAEQLYNGLRYNADGADSTVYQALYAAAYQQTLAATCEKKGIDPADPSTDPNGLLPFIQEQVAAGVQTEIEAQLREQAKMLVEQACKPVGEQAAQQATTAAVQMTKASVAQQIEAQQANGQSLVSGAAALSAGTQTLADQIPGLTEGIGMLQGGMNQLADGSGKLVANNQTLNSGMSALVNGTGKLTEGVAALDDGSHQLADGIVEFNESGIDKMVNSYNGDLKPLANKLQAMIDAGKDYQTYTDIADGVNGSVRFIYKMDAIKAAEE